MRCHYFAEDPARSDSDSFGYDVENRLGGGGSAVSYSQDGKRVFENGFIHFFGIDGRELGVYQPAYSQVQGVSLWTFSSQGTDIYFNGKMIQAKGQAVVTDRLGSVRSSLRRQLTTTVGHRHQRPGIGSIPDLHSSMGNLKIGVVRLI